MYTKITFHALSNPLQNTYPTTPMPFYTLLLSMANASTPHNLSNKPRLDKLLLFLLLLLLLPVLQSAFVGPLNWPELHTVLGAGQLWLGLC